MEVLPSGSIVWRYRYRLNGKREKLTLGKYPALTLRNARLKRGEAAHLVALGQSPAQKKQQEKVVGPENATVADFAERFFKDTLLHEQGWPSDVVEKALNHTIGGVRGVYNRAEYAEQRREMLQAWSDYIDGLVPSDNLVVGAASA